jgi:segregation and condensation protein B
VKLNELEAAAEALLFAAGEAVPLGDLARSLAVETAGAKVVLDELRRKLRDSGRGIEVIEVDGAYQLRTCSRYYDFLKRLLHSTPKKALSQTLLETLAIIAYRQPVSRGMIEEIRGVDATHAVNKLMEYGLICERGRSEQPGKPILFGTTDDFLKFYGFVSADNLPILPDSEIESETGAESENIGQLPIE